MLSTPIPPNIRWVPGHKDIIDNELADQQSKTGAQEMVGASGPFGMAEIKIKRLESPPSGHFMIVARVPVAPPTIRRHNGSKTKPML